MKTILSLVLVAFVTVAAAQEKQGKMRSSLSPEQTAELQTKKMAIALDLNESQQKDLSKLNKELARKRKQKMEKYKARKEKGEKLSDEERFNHMNAQLDEKLQVQKQMKKILSEEQYQQWRKMGAKRAKKKSELKKRRMRMQRQKRW